MVACRPLLQEVLMHSRMRMQRAQRMGPGPPGVTLMPGQQRQQANCSGRPHPGQDAPRASGPARNQQAPCSVRGEGGSEGAPLAGAAEQAVRVPVYCQH
jgi:hypothetical protein